MQICRAKCLTERDENSADRRKKKKRLKNAIRTNRGWNNNSNNKNQRNAENAVLIKNILRDLNIQPSLTANSLIDPPEEEESQFNRESLISVL